MNVPTPICDTRDEVIIAELKQKGYYNFFTKEPAPKDRDVPHCLCFRDVFIPKGIAVWYLCFFNQPGNDNGFLKWQIINPTAEFVRFFETALYSDVSGLRLLYLDPGN